MFLKRCRYFFATYYTVFMIPFSSLWSNHPHVTGEPPLLDRTTYPDQCAINVSAALIRSGVDMKSFTGTWSWQKDKPRYAIRAQELANWLATPAALTPFRVTKYPGKEAFAKMSGSTGIVFFQNYWGPGHQGDHIDFWNGSRLSDRLSWARIHLHLSWEGTISNYRNSESIWYWRVL
jgi:Type VI secretion system (T6SS), amidase effector protein 4